MTSRRNTNRIYFESHKSHFNSQYKLDANKNCIWHLKYLFKILFESARSPPTTESNLVRDENVWMFNSTNIENGFLKGLYVLFLMNSKGLTKKPSIFIGKFKMLVNCFNI
jgi:hypothetical protein